MKFAWAALATLLIVLQYQLWLDEGGLLQVHHLKAQLAKHHTANAMLRARNRVLASDVADLRHGQEAVEERARSTLGMIKPNETFYQIVERA